MMRIALLHNSFDAIGGAERFAVLIARELDADIITTSISSEAVRALQGDDLRIRSIGSVPKRAPFRQEYFKWRFSRLNLERYDAYLICGDWAIWAAPRNRPNVWYCHSPNRELWDLSAYTRRTRIKPYKRLAFDLWVRLNRSENLKRIRSVDRIIANSKNTAARIERYFGRESRIIYPPIEIPSTRPKEGSYWLSVNRMVPHKRIELQIEAFRRLPHERLVILAPYTIDPASRMLGEKIMRDLPENVQVITKVLGSEEVAELYRSATGVLATAKDEDFGLSIVEGFAHGKPAVAVDEGGFCESVTRETGLLVSAEPAAIADAIKTVSPNAGSYRRACLHRAKRFSVARTASAILEELELARQARTLI